MLNTNLSSAVFAAGLASRYLDSDGGHLILTGAKAAFKLTDCSGFMPGYGLSKMGVMNLAEMLRCEVDFKVSVIHPGTIDTPNNRAAMPDADFGEWHSVDGIAEGVKGIIEKGEGGDYTVETEGGKTWLEKI
jgi:NAD(P)-dependent dehydrogenase (short-subunit alcohol dehydrogenase family)